MNRSASPAPSIPACERSPPERWPMNCGPPRANAAARDAEQD
jgi:hypothetical protein